MLGMLLHSPCSVIKFKIFIFIDMLCMLLHNPCSVII